MNKIRTLCRRFKYRLTHGFFTIENVVLLLAIVLCLGLTFKTIESMSRNWELSERLSEDKKTLELLKIETQMAELENEYYRSDEYQDLLARKLANKKSPGENMVSMPENSETAKNKHKTQTKSEKEKEKSNFEKWSLFLFPNR
jgi:hypothetical protein